MAKTPDRTVTINGTLFNVRMIAQPHEETTVDVAKASGTLTFIYDPSSADLPPAKE